VIANEILFAGRRLDADEALRWGLINAVAPSDQLMETARELADRILASAPLAVGAIMEINQSTSHRSLDDAFTSMRSGDLASYQQMLASEDAAEGPSSFGTEDGPPRWKGR
jgi:crotonobetainyl-CoA hydratase